MLPHECQVAGYHGLFKHRKRKQSPLSAFKALIYLTRLPAYIHRQQVLGDYIQASLSYVMYKYVEVRSTHARTHQALGSTYAMCLSYLLSNYAICRRLHGARSYLCTYLALRYWLPAAQSTLP